MLQSDLNAQLYQKMFAEQERYKSWLVSQTSEEILQNAY